MEFGSIKLDELNGIDFTLPSGNADILQGANGPGKFYIGLPRWGAIEWVGNMYPRGTKEKDFLSFYIKHFNTIELNATHYGIQPAERVEKWRDTAAEMDFKFCPKMFKEVTHAGSLINKQNELLAFLESIRHFEDKLGAVFIQLSEFFPIGRARELESLLKSLPTDITFFLEVRHPEWFANKNWFKWLQDMNIGTVITDTAGRRDAVHTNLTIPKAMIRFVANNHATDKTRMDQWIRQLKEWREKGIEEIYFFVHSKNEVLSPIMVDYMREGMNA